MDIQNSLKVIADVQELSVNAINLVKKGISFGSLPAVLDMIIEVRALIIDAPAALPELKDLDGGEVAQLGAAAYDLTKSIMDALRA